MQCHHRPYSYLPNPLLKRLLSNHLLSQRPVGALSSPNENSRVIYRTEIERANTKYKKEGYPDVPMKGFPIELNLAGLKPDKALRYALLLADKIGNILLVHKSDRFRHKDHFGGTQRLTISPLLRQPIESLYKDRHSI